MTRRKLSILDQLCLSVDQALRAFSDKPASASYPGYGVDMPALNDQEKKHAAGLMRVNHAGEICAQALYNGQGLVSKSLDIREKMQGAAAEEELHLAWCRQRLNELGSHTSYLNPFWYAGSFCIGIAAGVVGDKWSLGFVAETEKQVLSHLAGHKASLPVDDVRSHKIISQMEADESKHREEAIACGARELPGWVKRLMGWTSKVMVKTAYWV